MKKIKKIKNIKINLKLLLAVELIVFAVLFIMSVAKLISSNPVIKETIALATTVKPETFTELYFENHNDLPKTINPNQNYSFIFTIHNLEYKNMNYPYSVYLETADTKIILDQGTFTLENNGYKSIKESFGPLKNTRMKITVELVNRNQVIDFWMDPFL
jgi:hypothetical protein